MKAAEVDFSPFDALSLNGKFFSRRNRQAALHIFQGKTNN